jgi:isopenicillin N synthase-like dioxygenase
MGAQSNPSPGDHWLLPIIDFEGFREDRRVEQEVARQIDDTFRTIGFCYIKNIGVSQELVDRLFEVSRRYHALPILRKMAVSINRFHRGYMASETEKLATPTVAVATRPSFSESFMFMHEIDAGDPRYGLLVHGPNQWPQELPELRTTVLEYQSVMEEFNRRLLGTLAIALDLPAHCAGLYRGSTAQ